jgi:hypothetical protein
MPKNTKSPEVISQADLVLNSQKYARLLEQQKKFGDYFIRSQEKGLPLVRSVRLKTIAGHLEEPAAYIAKNFAKLVTTSRLLACNNASYRNFGVGSVSIGADHNMDRLIITGGYNVKHASSTDKSCSEKFSLDKLAAKQAPILIAQFVAGNFQPDDTMPIQTTCLHQCSVCRHRLVNDDNWTDATILCMSKRWDDEHEIYTKPQFVELHSLPKNPKGARRATELIENASFGDPNFSSWRERLSGYDNIGGGYSSVAILGLVKVLPTVQAVGYILSGRTHLN